MKPEPLALSALAWLLLISGLRPSLANDQPVDLNTPRVFPAINSAQEWKTRAQSIREQVLVSCGLWPLPEKTPLNPKIFGRVERDGYTIEKVYFESYPGFHVAGNLYRPLGRKGPFPGVLNPHGHWTEGRMADTPEGSHAARCINFARQGMVAFSYDMVGYNDTLFSDQGDTSPYWRHRAFGTKHTDQLWNISLMGLQTWNSIRALDFLAGLEDVDPKRLSCTGESGGGTQTYMLGAIDSRLAVQAPVVMVSHSMQGGCSCENAPGLRVEYSNMEISAAAAPTPQFLVAATGDWTRATLTVEGPAIHGIYKLLGVPDAFGFVRFDYGHNYNQTSREAVYGWFNKWLLGAPTSAPVPETPYKKEPDADLRVFPNDQLPANAVTRNQLRHYLVEQSRAQLDSLMPRNRRELSAFKEALMPAWRHTLQLASAPEQLEVLTGGAEKGFASFAPAPGSRGRVEVKVARPEHKRNRRVLISVSPLEDVSSEPEMNFSPEGWTVVRIQQFSASPYPDQFTNFFTVYNRTTLQERVRDIVATVQYARQELGAGQVFLHGVGRAGLWTLLAAPKADGVIADASQLDTSSDDAFLDPSLFCPGLLKIGGFEGVSILSAPNPLFIHNTGTRFATQALKTAYAAGGKQKAFEQLSEPATPNALALWLKNL